MLNLKYDFQTQFKLHADYFQFELVLTNSNCLKYR